MVEKLIYRNRHYKDGLFKGEPVNCRGYMTPVFDGTDHLHFACQRCKEIVDILEVKRSDSYAQSPTIYFLGRCPKCRQGAKRKIYLEDIGKHYLHFPTTAEPLRKTPEEGKGGIIKREETDE